MKLFFLLSLLCSSAIAATDLLYHKKGFVIGIGANLNQYKFPVEFSGETKNKIDDSATLFGPGAMFGYDVVLFQHLLIGLRSEGLLADTLGTGESRNSKMLNRLSGKSQQVTGKLRLGIVFDFLTKSPVADNYQMLAELFLEGGVGSGKNSFSKTYTYTDTGVSESYHENLEETFTSQILAAGANLTTTSGAFLEVRYQQTTFTSNRAKFTGQSLVNGGTLQSTDRTVNNTHPDPIHSLVLMVGHHY